MNQRYKGIDYDWRPPSYWAAPATPLEAALRNVKGTNRRELISDFAAADIAEGVDPVLLQQSLEDRQRESLGRIHPSFMGGEYLPDYLEGEVEIARIELQSTTADVISIRARPGGNNEICYRIVDEHESAFGISPEKSSEPLSLAELVGLIDGADAGVGGGLAIRCNRMNLRGGTGAENLQHFTTVCSDVYPRLFEHYDRVHADWVEEVNQERNEADHDADGENTASLDAVAAVLEDDEELCRQLATNLAWENTIKPNLKAKEERRKRDEQA